MSGGPSPDDARRVRVAATSVGVWIAAASAVVLTVGVIVLVTVIIATSRSERGGRGGGGGADHVVVDVDAVVPWVIALGLLGIGVMALVGWLAARRAVRPLSDALALQHRFVADAGHELRTPLTALHSRVQTAQRRVARGEPVDDVLTALRADADTMNEVLTDLLLVAAGESSGRADVGVSVAEAARLLQSLATDAGVTLAGGGAVSGVAVALPQTALTRILAALADNAVQHAPAGSVVRIDAEADGHEVRVRVTDQGPGIAGASPEEVFARFARGAESGRRRGFGIGLALVSDLARRAGGSAAVERTDASGTVFLVRLPRVP